MGRLARVVIRKACPQIDRPPEVILSGFIYRFEQVNVMHGANTNLQQPSQIKPTSAKPTVGSLRFRESRITSGSSKLACQP